MLRNYFLLNLLLILIILVLGVKLYNILAYSPEIPETASVSEIQKKDVDIKGKGKVVNDSEYDIISRLDLFRPSRSASKKEHKKIETAPLKDPPKLFGTVILNDIRTAILEDPDSKKTKVYRIDDVIAGYRISDILENKVVLSGNGNTVDVRLRDDKGIKPPRKPAVSSRGKRKVRGPGTAQQRRARPVPPGKRSTRVRRRPDGRSPVTRNVPENVHDEENGTDQE